MKRKSYHHGDLKAALYKACHKLLKNTEPAEISLRTVADMAGVSHSAIYRHFKDKEELLDQMAAFGFDRLANAQKKAFERETNSEDGFIQLGLAYIKFATSNPHYYKIMFFARREMPSLTLKRAQIRSYSVLVQACKIFLEEKNKNKDAKEYALMCWSLVHGYSNLCIETSYPKKEAGTRQKTPLRFADDILRSALI